MIVPIWFAQNEEKPKAHRPSIISTLYSRDGETWQLGEIIGQDVLVNPSECALAVTKECKVLISIRNENDCHQRAFALSGTGFNNWEDLHFVPQMPDPICMGSMCHENGKLYHINCNSTTSRENLTVKISNDNFENYKSVFIDTPAGYSDIAVKDNTLYILYERDFSNDGLYFKKVKLS
jgi:sialidase-1